MDGPTHIFQVVRFSDVWRIVSDLGTWGRFPYRIDAEEAAAKAAGALIAKGQAALVLVQGSAGAMIRLRDAAYALA